MHQPLRVILGISGGIAAYKAPELVRRLRDRGHEVRCALTRSAGAFVTPLSLEIVSGRPVLAEEYLEPGGGGVERHIEAAGWADLICIAPATSHLLARLALGLSDDFLTTTCAAFDGPLVVAPAMHFKMWSKPTLQEHVSRLAAAGVRFVGPASGPLASGEVGEGRMADPLEIVAAVESAGRPGDLEGRTVLVSAGPTREPIDPVRYLSNRSSGRMGFAIAAAAAARGARVLLVAGPVELPTPGGVERIDVETAAEMAAAIHELAAAADLIVMSAAVADFRPRAAAAAKLEKRDGPPRLELEPTADILAGLRARAPAAVLVGFAAETSELEPRARAKLESKDLDFIVANDVSRDDIGFASDQNEVLVLRRGGAPLALERQPKRRLAAALMDLFAEELRRRASEPVTSRR